jgi:predicted Zn-dependent protease
MRMARAFDDSVDGLEQTSWQILSRPHGSPADYAFAATLIESACRARPRDTHLLITLGAAQFRGGQFQQAVATLDAVASAPDQPAHSAFLAMSQEKCGDHAAAVAALLRLRAYVSDARWKNDREAQGLLCEAEEAVAGPSMMRVGDR